MRPEGDERPPEPPEDSDGPEQEEPEQREGDTPVPDAADEPDKPEPADAPEPEYTVYGKGGEEKGKQKAPEREKKSGAAAKAGDKPDYKVYRSRPSLRDRIRKPDLAGLRGARKDKGVRERFSSIGGASGGRRWVKWLLIGMGVWLLISFVAFAISAQIQKGKLPDSAKQALDGGPDVLAGQNILILGGDRRGDTHSNASGSEGQGPPRADTIMVLHASLTSFRKLSIPRDVYAAIPDCGNQKINASLACNTNSPKGNPASTINTIKDFLGIDINHIVIIDFDGFADLINTLGGIKVKVKSKVCGDVDGGKKQGGVSIQLKAGEHTLEGEKALAFSRIRTNTCQPGEDDTDRAARQQAVLNGIKGRLTSPLRLPYNFIKGPLIGWNAPKAFISDMGGFTLPQLAIAAIFGGSGNTNILGKDGDEIAPSTTAGPGGSIFIGQGECREAVEELTGSEPDEDPVCSPD